MASQTDKLQLLVELDSGINHIQDLDTLLESILQGARIAADADAGSIYLLEDGKLHIKYSQNDTLTKKLQPGEKLLYGIFSFPVSSQTISGYAAMTAQLVNTPDHYQIPSSAPYRFDPKFDQLTGYKTVSSLTVPMVVNTGEILGVLQIINAKDSQGNIRVFNQEDELLVTHFASNASIALQRAKLTRTIILRMIRMAELRDPKETGPHVNRVAGYAAEIYQRWAHRKGRTAHEIQRNTDLFRMATLLHDVGKVGISDLILKKPGRFTPEEYEIMKTHTLTGFQLFADKQSEFDEIAAIVALTHHENWDGTGYPGPLNPETGLPTQGTPEAPAPGLKGEEIPIWGRIVAVADVYDALSCKRIYKEAWEQEEVLKEMRKLQGTKFDPELIDIFFEALPSIQQITQRYPDAH